MDFASFVLLLVLFSPVFLMVYFSHRKKKKEIRETRKAHLVKKALYIDTLFDKVMSSKTLAPQLNNIQKALDALDDCETFIECREVITNFDAIKMRLVSLQKVLPVLKHIDKAYKNRYKEKDKMELDALKDAMYEINTKIITNDDFELAQAFPEGTGEIVTIEGLIGRCRELGWEPKTTL